VQFGRGIDTQSGKAIEDRRAVEHGIGKGHPAPWRCRRRSIMQRDGVAGSKQHGSNGRAYIANPPHQNW